MTKIGKRNKLVVRASYVPNLDEAARDYLRRSEGQVTLASSNPILEWIRTTDEQCANAVGRKADWAGVYMEGTGVRDMEWAVDSKREAEQVANKLRALGMNVHVFKKGGAEDIGGARYMSKEERQSLTILDNEDGSGYSLFRQTRPLMLQHKVMTRAVYEALPEDERNHVDEVRKLYAEQLAQKMGQPVEKVLNAITFLHEQNRLVLVGNSDGVGLRKVDAEGRVALPGDLHKQYGRHIVVVRDGDHLRLVDQ